MPCQAPEISPEAPEISPEVKPDDIGFQTTFNLGHVAPDISPEIKADDIGFQTTSNLCHVRRLKYRLRSCQVPDVAAEISGSIMAPDKAPDVGPDICGSIILKISLSQALVYVTDIKPEDIGFDNSKDIVGSGS
ncbi:hypothetical protein FNV43_RR12850 [Rhamnella rubrinervis]|uniref:Uncharacterized protein n=1 Tax=Rhamnella rubrinervis TaxID=2594499 RepID=A0A8K0H015_9ROSA|nr:hypothetical protein FNV43_RR12850 [Rhamnella rubrinervis]